MSKIQSVQDYLEAIQNVVIENNVFFRGHPKDTYTLEPGIYRTVAKGKNLIEYEDDMYREVISKSPHEFVGKNTLESLALLQHYEAPTRVLDLTENALVALFFAVNKHNIKDLEDGEIIVFDIPDKSVCHYNSDRITVLSNIAKCNKDFYYSSDLVSIYREKINDLLTKKIRISSIVDSYPDEIFEFFQDNITVAKLFAENDNFDLTNYDQNLESLVNEYESNFGKLMDKDFQSFEDEFVDSLIKILNRAVNISIKHCNDKYFGKLIHNIREDKAYFDAIIDPEHLSQVFAIRPKFDNPRIIRQQGAFLIFGLKEVFFPGWDKCKPMAELNSDWISRGPSKDRIIIDKDSKNNILKELEQLGINQSILFPEVDKVADFVRKKYTAKL